MPNWLHAQSQFYNLDITNGLPSNHVYRTIVDRKGYLWIATDRGVAKYNGYNLKVFNSLSGLQNSDVWNLYEDLQGRIWLGTVSPEIGYIYNDEYHKAYYDDPMDFYPSDFLATPMGVMFITSDRQKKELIIFEKNDTFTTYDFITYTWATFFVPKGQGFFSMRMERDFYLKYDGYTSRKIKHDHSFIDTYGPNIARIGNYLFATLKSNENDTVLHVVSCLNDSDIYLPLEKYEHPIVPIEYRNNYYLTTNKRLYRFDKDLHLIHSLNVDSVLGEVQGSKIDIVTFTENDFADRCISTADDGIIIQSKDNRFNKSHSSLVKNKFVGNYYDSAFYWWEGKAKILYKYLPYENKISQQQISIKHVNNIFSINKDSIVLLSKKPLYLYSNKTSEFFPLNNRFFAKRNGVLTEYRTTNIAYSAIVSLLPSGIRDCIRDSSGTIHMVAEGIGYWHVSFNKDSTISESVDSARYLSLVYSRKLKSYIVQGKNNLLIEQENSVIKMNASQLSLLGINELERVLTDTFGNIFIKSREKLFLLNPLTGTCKSILNNLNFSNANIHIYKNKLIVVGRFGVSVSGINGPSSLSLPSTYINFKSQNYKHVSNSYVFIDSLFIQSDNGVYSFDIDNNTPHTFTFQYSLFISSDNYNHVVKAVDTIIISQNADNINWDFINPYGDGIVKYTYSIDGVSPAIKVSANSIELPYLTPGKYFKMKLVVRDDAWVSDEYTIYLFVKPYWWQTQTGKIWLTIIFGFVAIVCIIVIVLITRYVLNKRHEKENKYLELELKSIYSQLNPHFIFNTLSNIVYYIKKDRKQEAYKYLNTFSKLLRSYIKSSRNKWLPLSEELDNIESYILLQQTRFDDKFDYTINIDPNLNAEQVLLPSLLLQPLVENAIHHGLQPKIEKGHLSLSFKLAQKHNVVVVTIEDDGIGRIKAKEFAINGINKKESFGSNLIEDLVTIYKHYELFDINIEYYDKVEPEMGTVVTITITYNTSKK
ncbi:MAG: hypothetical protein EOP47_07995 [Sphingobacteriaceae bacterium]|nr:MAG: hypothetical protein EOP47_07995 [Sphingobacteriaceae bacterium]